jgi:hypothetical protein
VKSGSSDTQLAEKGHSADAVCKKPDAPAIARFASFLENRRCIFWMENELDQVLPIRKTKPDFFVRTADNLPLLVEIESFEKERFTLVALRQNNVMSGLSHSDHKRISNAVQHASNQLKPYRDLGFPNLIVLDDFRDVGMPANPDIIGLSLLDYFDSKTDRSHLSAVAWLMGGRENPLHLRIFHNPHALAALPKEMFREQADEHWRRLPGQFWKRHV